MGDGQEEVVMPFADRRDAGRALAVALEGLESEQPVVLGLPRGGIPVAAEVAHHLDAPLDVLVVRKLGVPNNPEFGFGAVAERGVRIVDTDLCSELGMRLSDIDRIATEQEQQVRERVNLFRAGRSMVDVQGKTVIVVDDGLATGSTALAAVAALRAYGALRIVVAVPVGSPHAVARLRRVADEVVCLETPPDLRAIGNFYADFAQVDDQEVCSLLQGRVVEAAHIPVAGLSGDILWLPATLTVPCGAQGLVVFAHGSGSSRLSPRNQQVARLLQEAHLATLLFDLMIAGEETDRRRVFDVGFLAGRLLAAVSWVEQVPSVRGLPVGLFGASTGAAAALIAAAKAPERVHAVVSRGGRPDLASSWLPHVTAPTLFIVGGDDVGVLDLNQSAAEVLRCVHRLEIVPHATHLFEEPGALERVAALAAAWFREFLDAHRAAPRLEGATATWFE